MSEWINTIFNQDTRFTTPLPDKNFLSCISKETSVLDIGCGYGRTLTYLSKLNFKQLTGFDISSSYIKKAKNDCPNANIFIANFKDFELKQSYDLILLMGIIEYLITDEEQHVFFRKISQNLNSDGSILLETFIVDIKSNWNQYIMGFLKSWHWGYFKNSLGFECHHQSIKQLNKILLKYFKIESSKQQTYLTWTGSICNGCSYVLKKK